MDKLITVYKPRRWEFWRKPIVVSMRLLAQHHDLVEQHHALDLQQQELEAEFAEMQNETKKRDQQKRLFRRWARYVNWWTLPAKPGYRSYMPGIGLELGIVLLFVSVLVGTIID